MYFKCRLARYVTVVLLNLPNAVLIINIVETSISTYSVHHGKTKIASLSVLTRYNCKGLQRTGLLIRKCMGRDRTGKTGCNNEVIVADTNEMFPRLPARATFVADTKNVSDFETFCVRNKCFPVCAAQETS